MVDKSDPLAKVGRAKSHVQDLVTRVATFAGDSYSIGVEPDVGQLATLPIDTELTLYAQASHDPPSDEWAPIIGDIVHGFRSALDQLIWCLSVDNSGPPPPDPLPFRDSWRMIAFPVYTTRWAQTPRGLWAIDGNLVAQIKALQPYVTGQQAPDLEPLAVLNELWNIDKHRHLHVVNATVELHDVPLTEPIPGAPDAFYEITSKRCPGPFVGRTEIGRVKLRNAEGAFEQFVPQVYMNTHMAIDVAFDQGLPATAGRSVLHTLSEIDKTVDAILAAF